MNLYYIELITFRIFFKGTVKVAGELLFTTVLKKLIRPITPRQYILKTFQAKVFFSLLKQMNNLGLQKVNKEISPVGNVTCTLFHVTTAEIRNVVGS